jgi:uncharacterized protein (TIGR02145 family)
MKHLISLALLLMGLSASAQTIMNIYQNNGTVLQIPLSSIDSITYTVNNPGNLATLTTLPMGNITATSAVSGGNITGGGGTPVTQRGVCWSTAPNPTTANNTTSNGSGVGNYASTLTGLTAGATYYVRAYATNSAGTAYGNQLQFTAAGGGGGIVSNPGAGVTFSGYSYTSVVLGNGQEWMAENLRSTTYANGDPIPNVTDGNQWLGLTTGAWAHYENNASYENPYGKLYNWYAVADPRNVCPTGWHVPTDAEWNTLVGYLDPAYDPNAPNGSQSATAGGKMKSTGTQYWFFPNEGATNESGFSGLPAGLRSSFDGTFGSLGTNGYWWSASESGAEFAWSRFLYYYIADINRYGNFSKRNGFLVRCLRD